MPGDVIDLNADPAIGPRQVEMNDNPSPDLDRVLPHRTGNSGSSKRPFEPELEIALNRPTPRLAIAENLNEPPGPGAALSSEPPRRRPQARDGEQLSFETLLDHRLQVIARQACSQVEDRAMWIRDNDPIVADDKVARFQNPAAMDDDVSHGLGSALRLHRDVNSWGGWHSAKPPKGAGGVVRHSSVDRQGCDDQPLMPRSRQRRGDMDSGPHRSQSARATKLTDLADRRIDGREVAGGYDAVLLDKER